MSVGTGRHNITYNSVFGSNTVSFLGIHQWEFAVLRERVIQYSELFSRFELSFCHACKYGRAEVFLTLPHNKSKNKISSDKTIFTKVLYFIDFLQFWKTGKRQLEAVLFLFWHCGFSAHILLYAVCACLQHIFKYFLL
jgi:hypothetical protein